tara:strand:- start:130 stop:888 length:759 start_codon:yes stop_codon:yes gene_type:complete
MIEILFLSLIQGITEFLPISSSSHLIIFSEFSNFQEKDLSIDVSLHIGSFIAVVTYFHKDLKDFVKNKQLFFKIIVSSVPVMLAGYLLVKTNLIEELRNLKLIGWTTLLFGILLLISDKCKLINKLNKNLNYKSAIIIGVFQVLSLIPGVSRSGITITAARFLKFNRYDAAKISFLLSIPTLGAVSIYGIQNLIFEENIILSQFNILSIFLSFIFSLITIKFFLGYIQKFSLNIFIFYRLLIGFIILTISYL